MQSVSVAGPGDQQLHPISRRCPLGNLVVELILLLLGSCGLAAGNP
jgi:hypothetical protein